MMRAPSFWWRPPGLAARLLQPLGAIYGTVTAQRMARRGRASPLPVICVGNFVAGGAGKTPFAIEVAQRLAGMGERPAFLTRGHGGQLAGPILVDPAKHSAAELGDEPLLLARYAEAIVARRRDLGAKLAEAIGASVIVMDDGLQNAALEKDLTFATVDGETGVGNGLCLPAGPLRAPLSTQWRHVQALVVMGEPSTAGELLKQDAARRGLPMIAASLVPDISAAEGLRGRSVIGFAAIGRPEKFFATLRSIGADLAAGHGFPDHHRFAARELEELIAQARAKGAILVTTEKDMMRIKHLVRTNDMGRSDAGPGWPPADVELRELPVHARIADGPALEKLIAEALMTRRIGIPK
jgi:tetraacyldisaccharide 4'-kinase